MKYCYANRRQAAFPDVHSTWTAAPEHFTDGWLRAVSKDEYDGLEVGANTLDLLDGDAGVEGFKKRLEGYDLPIVAVRAGGSLIEAKSAIRNLGVMRRSVDYAEAVGSSLVVGNLMAPQRYLPPGWEPTGQVYSQDSSRDASIYLYERVADSIRPVCDAAADRGITIAIEMHHASPVDNSWSARLLCDLVDRPNFGINPDIGNVAWAYHEPEETPEDNVRALADLSVYWHCKNVVRVVHPENERSVGWKVSLEDGEMDYRFLMTAMVQAGYDGYVAIEGGRVGDQFEMDTRSLKYMRRLEAEVKTEAGS
ncbi:MAG: sugar phosphate isomerase/epimerase family protein [Dehalococcoidia bacterium]|jgi:sugar phosphate isomerase/epimerase|nr:sugar phosphate isomerase/epimerase family protein [Dehalococcoidia bacterium]